MKLIDWLEKNYKEIMLMSKKITKSSKESDDVAHYVITEFSERKDAQALIDRNEGMKFMSGMIWRSFHSSTSPYHTIYRQKGRVFGLSEHKQIEEVQDDEYDYDKDIAIEGIQGVIEDMKGGTIELWYKATLFEMWVKESNYSQLSRQTGIPRTSISHAVEEARKYIQYQLKINNITYE
tara:strand:- start:79 stop:615 length:537 start_codon:yes stop_codon:yes gene_type:complete